MTVTIRHGDEPVGLSDPSHTHVLAGSLVPTGGTTGEVLTKKSGTDGDTDWEAGGGGGGAAVVTVALTNAQIKALPTTRVELVAAQGSGKAILVLGLFVTLNPSAGAYTNVNAGAVLVVDGHAGIATGPIFAENATYSNPLFVDSQTDVSLGQMVPMIGYTGGGGIVTGAGNYWDNGNLSVRLDNQGAGALTGGDAANTLSITVVYVVVTL